MANFLCFTRVRAGAVLRRWAIPLALAFVAGCGGGGDSGGGGNAGGGGNGGGNGGGGGGSDVGSFAAVSQMGTPRFSASSALLPSGKVLVAGGFRTTSDTLETAEIFDPASGTWAATASMRVTRAGNLPFLVRLNDGRVLALSSAGAETYDEATSRWSQAASPPGPLAGPYLLLPDGRVLGWSSFLGQALIYDPAVNTWLGAAGFDGRTKFSAVLLADGRVLVSGGQLAGRTDRTTTTLLFNPNAGTWQAGPSMNVARSDHFSFRLDDGRIVVSHGVVSSLTLSGTTEVYQPANGSWTIAGNVIKFNISTTGATGTRLADGRFLVAGGGLNGGVISDQKVQGQLNETNAEYFDAATLSWHRASPEATGLVQPRFSHTAVRLADGRVLIAGGMVGISTLTAAEVYRP